VEGQGVAPEVGSEGVRMAVGLEVGTEAASGAALVVVLEEVQEEDLEAEMEVDLVEEFRPTTISLSRLEILDLDPADLQVSLFIPCRKYFCCFSNSN
jgi:hypothetical protein